MFGLNIRKIFFVSLTIVIIINGSSLAQDRELKKAKECRLISTKVAREIKIPKGYHEGLYYDGKYVWVTNGEEINTWVVDIESGVVEKEIKPVAGFTEALTMSPGGSFFTTDWVEKKLYEVRIEDDAMIPQRETLFEPAHPAGALWVGDSLYVITWERGLGTKFYLLEMDEKFNVSGRISLWAIQEAAHMAWDGKNLWIASWFDKKVYRVDIKKWEITGYFDSPAPKTTGIVWDGKYMWLTGTYSDLYQIEIING